MKVALMRTVATISLLHISMVIYSCAITTANVIPGTPEEESMAERRFTESGLFATQTFNNLDTMQLADGSFKWFFHSHVEEPSLRSEGSFVYDEEKNIIYLNHEKIYSQTFLESYSYGDCFHVRTYLDRFILIPEGDIDKFNEAKTFKYGFVEIREGERYLRPIKDEFSVLLD